MKSQAFLSSPDEETIKLSGTLLTCRLHVFDPSRGRTPAAELDHSLHRRLVALKDSLYAAVREVLDPTGDSFGSGLALHGPPKSDTLYSSTDQYACSHCHVPEFGGGMTYQCRGTPPATAYAADIGFRVFEDLGFENLKRCRDNSLKSGKINVFIRFIPENRIAILFTLLTLIHYIYTLHRRRGMRYSYQDQALCDPLVINALDDGLLVVNEDRRVVWCNPTLVRTLAVRQEDVIGTGVLVLFGTYLEPILQDESSAQQIRQALDNGADLPALLCRTRNRDGTQRWLSISTIPAHAEIGAWPKVIRIRDVTGDVNAHNFRTALDRSPVVVFAQDRDLRYVWSYNQQLGPTDTSIIGMADPEAFLTDEAAHLTALKRRVLETGEIIRAEAVLTFAGEPHVRDLTLKPLRDASGDIVGITGTAFDVTERDRAEAALRKRTYDLNQRMNELRCLYTIAHLVEVPGITLDELLQAVADMLPSGWQYPDNTAVRITVEGREYRQGDPAETPWKQKSPIVARGARVGEVEVRYLHERPEAAEGPFLQEERMLLDAVAERLGRVIELMRAEAALQESEEKFRGIAQRSFDLIATSYLVGGLNYVSPAMERILGYHPEEMAGTDWEDYILPSSLSVWGDGRRKVLRGEQVEGLRVEVRRKDGETAVLELNESPIVENGVIVGFQAVGRDISERILYERLREQAFDMTARNIAQFAVLADHVRHPLQVIMGIADLLEDDETAEKLREQVQRINRRVSQLDREWMESRKIREFLKRYEL